MVIFQIYSGKNRDVSQYIVPTQRTILNKKYVFLPLAEQVRFYSPSFTARSGNYTIVKTNIFLSITKNEPALRSTYMQTRLFHSKTTLSKGGLLNCGKFVVRQKAIKPGIHCNYWVFGLLLIQRFHCGDAKKRHTNGSISS